MRPDPASPVASSERTATFVYRTAGLVSEQAVRVQPGPDLPRGKVEWTSIERHVRNSAVSFQVGKCFEGHPVPGSRKVAPRPKRGKGAACTCVIRLVRVTPMQNANGDRTP